MRKLALNDEILLKIEKPARYIGNEVNSVMKDKNEVDIRFAMCFPDVYEIGMSHLGIQILYDMFNQREDVWCERVYSPWLDLHKIMKEEQIPLFALESQDPIREFDFLGITIQYEMCYTNILQILDLSRIPIHSRDRSEADPIVIGGGPCTYNPEPLAEFFDIFYIGEGETVYDELLDAYKEYRAAGKSRIEFLERAAQIEGLYVPMFYDATYHEDGTLASFAPNNEHAPSVIKKQMVLDVTEAPYPQAPVVPFIKATQDRVVLEIQRGCIRGCRFCQAGMLYRPTRERNVERLKQYAKAMLESTGHEEISLSSLSSSDYSELKELVTFLIDEFKGEGINISLPSLRIDAFSLDVKPFTPFQWAQMFPSEEYIRRATIVKHEFLQQLNKKSLKYNWHEADVTVLEGVFARGDRKVGKVIEEAYRLGCLYDSWSESFDNEKWMQAFANTGVDIEFYTMRKRSMDELFPWDFIDIGVTKNFLKKEWERAMNAQVTPNCRMQCSGCGAAKFGGGVCFEGKN